MNLPDDSFFAYTVMHETYYAHVMGGKREIAISATSNGGGAEWEFMAEEIDLGGTTVKVHVFRDGFAAFTQIPEFFAALAAEQPTDLKQVAALLDRLGARDMTERADRNGVRLPRRDSLPGPLVDRLVDLGWTPPNNLETDR